MTDIVDWLDRLRKDPVMPSAAFDEAIDEIKSLRAALTQIASMTDPDEMETDDNGLTEWGCEINDAVHMAYENAITIAQLAIDEAAIRAGGEG